MLCRVLTGAGNVLGKKKSDWFKVHSMTLQNTFEQNLLFVINLLCAGAFEEISRDKLVIVTVIYLAGRVLFYIGYLLAGYLNYPPFRYLGFFVTFMNNLFLMALNLKSVVILISELNLIQISI